MLEFELEVPARLEVVSHQSRFEAASAAASSVD
jgi:hypothetical protein